MSAVLMNFSSKSMMWPAPDLGPPGASTPKYCKIHDIDAGQREGSFGVRWKLETIALQPFPRLGELVSGGIILRANDADEVGVGGLGHRLLVSACNLSPSAPTTLRMVSNPGLRSPESAL